MDDTADPALAQLFARGTALEAAPWPALVMDERGAIRATNSAAATITSSLAHGWPDQFDEAVRAGVGGRTTELDRLDLVATTGDGGTARRSFRIQVLPWQHGETCLVLAREMTEQQQQWAELRARTSRCCGIVETMGDGFAWETDREGRLVYVSHPAVLGGTAATFAGADPVPWAGQRDTARAVFQATAPVHGTHLTLAPGTGEPVPYRADAAPILDADGTWLGARGICRDIGELQRREITLQRVRQREQLLYTILRVTREEGGPQAILDTAAQGILPALDAEGAAVYRRTGDGDALVAHAGTAIPENAVSQALAALAEGRTEIATADRDTDLLALATTHGGRTNGALCLWHAGGLGGWTDDERTLAAELAAQIAVANTQLRRETEWRRLSETDSLTGLVNRRAFLAYLSEHLDSASAPGALLYIDLDNFKRVNDVHGHIAGDDVLAHVGHLLKAHTRSDDVAARLGGDEFALFLTDITPETAMRRAAALVDAAREALAAESGDSVHPLGLSVGVAATHPDLNETATDLLERADVAMYAAKDAGKGDVVAADPPGSARRRGYAGPTSA